MKPAGEKTAERPTGPCQKTRPSERRKSAKKSSLLRAQIDLLQKLATLQECLTNGAWPPPGENISESDRQLYKDVLKIITAGSDPAGKQGVIKSSTTQGSETMKTPQKKRSQPGAHMPGPSTVLAFQPIPAQFGRTYKIVKFPDRAIARIGFRLLYRSGHQVTAFGNYTFGLSSDKQLELLLKNQVSHEVLE